jgi:hypothetical protein
VGLIKMCLNEICSRFRTDKNMSDKFTVQNGLVKGHALLSLLFNFDLGCHQEGRRESGRIETESDTSASGLC